MFNKFDNANPPIFSTFNEYVQAHSAYTPTALSRQHHTLLQLLEARLRFYTTGFLYRTGLLRRLIYANLKLDWFYDFREYWMKELKLRRLELPDFYFLAGVYRQKFQSLEVGENDSATAFLQAWQAPATLSLLFAYQYKLALHPLAAYTLAKYLPQRARICEFGCGLAPITQSLIQFYPHRDFNITAADIPSYLLHYVSWKLRRLPYVRVLPLDPADDSPLTDTYDVIACMTVFEHLPRPLAIARHFHRQLKPGGLLMFDYITSEGTGLDTAEALTERLPTLTFIRDNFEIVRGTIPLDGSSVSAVICRKR